MAPSTTTVEPQDSMLLKLPAELRTQIYEDTLVDSKVIEVVTDYLRRRFPDLPNNLTWQSPRLLQSCRQIRNEARSIYYAKNRFALPEDGLWEGRLLDWLKALDPVYVASIKHVRIMSLRKDAPSGAITVLNHFLNVWLGKDGIALPKHAIYTAVEVTTRTQSVFIDGEELPELAARVWLDLGRLETAAISRGGHVVVETLHGLDEVC